MQPDVMYFVCYTVILHWPVAATWKVWIFILSLTLNLTLNSEYPQNCTSLGDDKMQNAKKQNCENTNMAHAHKHDNSPVV